MPHRQPHELRFAVVVNGNARGVTDDLVSVLDEILVAGDLYVSRTLEEGREIAKRIVEKRYDVVLTGGGDGTFVQMVTWITEDARALGVPRPGFGFLRLGTGNALAWVLGATSGGTRGVLVDIARARRAGAKGSLRLIDVAGKLAPFAGIGVDGMAVQDFESVKSRFERIPFLGPRATGGLAYVVSIGGVSMPKVLMQPTVNVRIVNEGSPTAVLGADGKPRGPLVPHGQTLFEGPVRSCIFSTIPFWGFGAKVFPLADPRGDRFHLRAVNIDSVAVARNLRGIWNGTYRSPDVAELLVERVAIELEKPVPLEVAGDAAGSFTRLPVALHDEPVRVVDFFHAIKHA